MNQLTRLFGDNGLQLKLPSDLLGTVETPMPLQTGTLDGSKSLPVLGQTLTLDGSLTGSVEVHPIDGQVVDEQGTSYLPPAGQAFTDIRVRGAANIGGAGSGATGPLQLAFSAKVSGGIGYCHLRPAPAATTRVQALTDLATSSRIPMLMDPTALLPGELQQLLFNLSLDLNLNAQYGFGRDFQTDLFGKSNVPFTAAFNGGLQASIGLALQGDFAFTLERITPAQATDPDQQKWVRAVIARSNQNRLSLAAKLDVEVTYDLGTGLVGLLDEVLQTPGVKGLFDQLNEITTTLSDFESGALLERLKGQVSDKLNQTLQLYLDRPLNKALDYLDQPEIAKLLAQTNKALAAYNQLDTRIQDLWSRALTSANLAPGSKLDLALTKLASIDLSQPEQALQSLLGNSADEVALLESLTGVTLEELVLGSQTNLTAVLTEVVSLAQKAKTFLDTADDQVIARIKDFTQKTGIQATVNWLNQNMPADGSVATLQANLRDKANVFIQENVSKLVGRAWDKIDGPYMAEVQQVVGKINSYLVALPEQIPKLKEKLMKLKGQVGFSLGFEWERVSKRTALVDFSFDPTDANNLAAFKHLQAGNIPAFFNALPESTDNARFQLNDSLFTRAKMRTGAFNLLLSALGAQRTASTREQSASVRIRQTETGWHREGSYLGRYTRTLGAGDDVWESSATLTVEATAPDKNLKGLYQTQDVGLGLSVTRNDTSTDGLDLQDLCNLLNTLGFTDAFDKILGAGIPENVPTRLAANLSLSSAALSALLPLKVDDWKKPYLNAGWHWFNTTSTTRLGADRVGPYLSQYIKEGAYPHIWWNANIAGKQETLRNTAIAIPSQSTDVNRRLKTIQTWPGLVQLPSSCKDAPDRFQKFKKTWDQTQTKPIDEVYWDTMNSFGGTIKAICPTGWSSPMFPVYMILCTLQAKAPQLLQQVKGIATFRWQANGEWQPPVVLSFTQGLQIPLPVRLP